MRKRNRNQKYYGIRPTDDTIYFDKILSKQRYLTLFFLFFLSRIWHRPKDEYLTITRHFLMLGTFLNQRGSLRYLRHSVPSILKTLYVIQKYTQSKKMPVVYLQYNCFIIFDSKMKPFL